MKISPSMWVRADEGGGVLGAGGPPVAFRGQAAGGKEVGDEGVA